MWLVDVVLGYHEGRHELTLSMITRSCVAYQGARTSGGGNVGQQGSRGADE